MLSLTGGCEMSTLSQYSMMSTTSTTLIFGLIFLFLARQSSRIYMTLWGLCWIVYSVMFFLDFTSLSGISANPNYVAERQILTLAGSLIFLLGTHDFFQLKPPKYLYCIVPFFFVTIVLSHFSRHFYELSVIPNIMFSSTLLIWAGCMFISCSWTQNVPEKLIASFLIIVWAVFSNHFGFTANYIGLATFNYFTGLFMVNLLILFLMIIHFKKTRFLYVKSEDRYRLLVENSSDSMFLYNYKKHSFRYISPSVQPLLGIPANELYHSPERFFENIEINSENKQLLTLFENPIHVPSKAILCLTKGGQPSRWCEMHYLPILDALGMTTAVEGILRDITERKQIEESLKASESARKELVENISHELRTPITLIQGYIESMLNDVIPAASVQSYLKVVHSKLQMLNTLLEDLIQVSHFTSQSLDYKFYELQAGEFFLSIIGQSELQITRSGKTFSSEISLKDNIEVIVDPSRIEQVISNLVNNSMRHTPPGGAILLKCNSYQYDGFMQDETSLAIPHGEIVFTVSDTGEGIHPDDIPHLFDRKFRGRNRNGIPQSGRSAGLGLFISLQIIKQHSGRMWAENNEEVGARISFAIPYYRT